MCEPRKSKSGCSRYGTYAVEHGSGDLVFFGRHGGVGGGDATFCMRGKARSESARRESLG